jgi:hypothetical protein
MLEHRSTGGNMSEFSEKGPSGSGSAMAALAIVRALIDRLQTLGALSEEDVEVIFQDALRQIGGENTDAKSEAKRLVGSLKG